MRAFRQLLSELSSEPWKREEPDERPWNFFAGIHDHEAQSPHKVHGLVIVDPEAYGDSMIEGMNKLVRNVVPNHEPKWDRYGNPMTPASRGRDVTVFKTKDDHATFLEKARADKNHLYAKACQHITRDREQRNGYPLQYNDLPYGNTDSGNHPNPF